jgi:hypothetical protein
MGLKIFKVLFKNLFFEVIYSVGTELKDALEFPLFINVL